MYVFRPRVVFAWKQFPTDVTRWHLQNGDWGGQGLQAGMHNFTAQP